MKRILITDRNIKAAIGEINKIFDKVAFDESVKSTYFNFNCGYYRRSCGRRPKHLSASAKMTVIKPIARFTNNQKGEVYFTISSKYQGLYYSIIPVVMVGSIVLIDNLSVHFITKSFLTEMGRMYGSFTPFQDSSVISKPKSGTY